MTTRKLNIPQQRCLAIINNHGPLTRAEVVKRAALVGLDEGTAEHAVSALLWLGVVLSIDGALMGGIPPAEVVH